MLVTVLISLGVGLLFSGIMYAVGYDVGYKKAYRERATMRRGVIEIKNFSWGYHWHDHRPYIAGTVKKIVVVVREIDRIAHQSQVEIVGVDNCPFHVAENHIP